MYIIKKQEVKKVEVEKEKVYLFRVDNEIQYLKALEELRKVGMTNWANGDDTNEKPLLRQFFKAMEEGWACTIIWTSEWVICKSKHIDPSTIKKEYTIMIGHVTPDIESIYSLVEWDVLVSTEKMTLKVRWFVKNTDWEILILLQDFSGEIFSYKQSEITSTWSILEAERPVILWDDGECGCGSCATDKIDLSEKLAESMQKLREYLSN